MNSSNLRRRWPKHKAWIAHHSCALVWNVRAAYCAGDVVAAHVRRRTDGGTALKPSDWWTIPLCDKHHMQQHSIGEPAFERLYNIDMKAIARTLTNQSPDKAMREAMRQAEERP